VGDVLGNFGIGGDFGEKIFDIAKDVAPPILLVAIVGIVTAMVILTYIMLKQRREEW